MTAAPPRRLAAVLFALFVVATGGAFFVTQRLKRSSPIVTRVFFYQWIGPDCHCRKDHVTVRFDLPKAQRVTASLVNRQGEVVKTFADDVFLSKGTHPFRWDGRGSDGLVVPDGSYRLRVGLRAEGRSVTAPRVLHVDSRAPRPRIVAVTPPTVVPGSAGRRARARIRFVGPSNPAPEFGVWRTDGGKARQVAGFSGRRGRHTATWDGLVNGKPAPEGSYAFSVTVQDQAGNKGSVPRRLPPLKRDAVPRSGVAVAYFTLNGPLVPVRPGAIARFTVGPLPRPTRWRLAPYARGGTIRSGVSHGSTIAVRIPRGASSDVYSLFATDADGRRAAWPLVVSNSGGAAPVLVVVPAMTWQGQNPVESNRDGWPDTLDTGDPVPLARGFLHGRPPRSIATDTVSTLEFLSRIRANYDLTTDVALAAGKTPGIEGHNGVLLAGSERWLTPKLNLQLRRFVSGGGGTVVSFGEDALRRGVDLQKGTLVDPSSRRRTDIFGERATPFGSPEAPLVLSQDKLNIFGGSDGFIGNFTRFERSDALDAKAALLTAGGRADPTGPSKPDFVGYTLGKGLVIRVGTDQWPAALNQSPEVANATRRMWTLLSR
ncbi:MAG TPA: FlgD immunoglobulin-like domain containing protein [Thermoleophilaceae bacterium]|nr:FlgD immunoglobulin-like domain containing protein [Thermoleophilaceae bacterium]